MLNSPLKPFYLFFLDGLEFDELVTQSFMYGWQLLDHIVYLGTSPFLSLKRKALCWKCKLCCIMLQLLPKSLQEMCSASGACNVAQKQMSSKLRGNFAILAH